MEVVCLICIVILAEEGLWAETFFFIKKMLIMFKDEFSKYIKEPLWNYQLLYNCTYIIMIVVTDGTRATYSFSRILHIFLLNI